MTNMKLSVILAILLYASSVNAMDEVLAENARLRSENTLLSNALTAENARSQAEIAQLKAEIARLQAKKIIGVAELEEGEKTGADDVDDDDAGKICTSLKGKKTNPAEHCNGKCWMLKAYFEKTCKMTERSFKFELGPNKLRQVGTSAAPKWEIYGYGSNMKEYLGSVSCPCSADGTALTETDAIRTIVGQVGAMAFPDEWAKKMCKARGQGRKSSVEAQWNSKVTLSTIAMLKCWKKKCEKGSSAQALDDLLIEATTEETAGWDCG